MKKRIQVAFTLAGTLVHMRNFPVLLADDHDETKWIFHLNDKRPSRLLVELIEPPIFFPRKKWKVMSQVLILTQVYGL